MNTDRTEAERLAHLTSVHKEWREDDCNVCFLIGQITRLQQERDRMRDRYHAAIEQGMEAEKERDAALKELKEYGENRDLIHRAAELIKTSEAHDRAGQLAAALQERDAASREAGALREEVERLRELFRIDGEQHSNHIRGLTETHETRIMKYAETIKALREEVGGLEKALVKLQGDYCVATTPPNPMEAPTQPTAAREMRPNAEARRKRAWNRAAARSFGKGIDEHELRHAVEEALQDVWDAAVVATITAVREQPTTDDVERAREILTKFCTRPGCSFALDVAEIRTAARAQGIAQGRAEMREMAAQRLEALRPALSGPEYGLAAESQRKNRRDDHAQLTALANIIRALPTTPTKQG